MVVKVTETLKIKATGPADGEKNIYIIPYKPETKSPNS